MVVNDKQSDIAILRTLGASPSRNHEDFYCPGGVCTEVFGTVIGVILGVALAMNLADVVAFIEGLFNVNVIPGDVYFIGFLPSELHWNDVFVVTSVALLLTVLATLYPAWKASRVNPADALRYE